MSIEIANESGVAVDETSIVSVARFALSAMRIDPLAELSVLLVDTEAMAELHEQWMKLPGPTDVMAFPMDELAGARRPDAPDVGPALLGDVVLCPPFAREQARKAGHGLLDELHLLTVHGVLHLLGYDHAEPDEEREMFALQNRILADYRTARDEAERQAAQRSVDSRVLGAVGLQDEAAPHPPVPADPASCSPDERGYPASGERDYPASGERDYPASGERDYPASGERDYPASPGEAMPGDAG